jgi:hypothetical protein
LATKPKATSNTPNTDAQNASILAGIVPFLDKLLATSGDQPSSTTTTSTQSSSIKLTYASAKALLLATLKDMGTNYNLKADVISEFMKEFNTLQDKQREKIIQTASNKIVPKAGAEAAKKVVEDVYRQEFPTFFKPQEFASEFLWKKIDFKDDTVLGNKTMGILQSVRGLVDAFNLLGVDDNAMRLAAKRIAMGKMTLEEYNVELQQLAKKEYPAFADRFDKDPTLTTADIAAPVINLLAKTWAVDPKTIKKDNGILMSYMNFAGPDGKGKQPSMYDILLKAKADPRYELTEEANNNARDAATGLARAFGFGV